MAFAAEKIIKFDLEGIYYYFCGPHCGSGSYSALRFCHGEFSVAVSSAVVVPFVISQFRAGIAVVSSFRRCSLVRHHHFACRRHLV